MKRGLGIFLSGVLAGAMLLGCGTAALAAGGGVTFGAMGLKTISGKTVVEPGERIMNASGCEIPAAIIYTDEKGCGNTYLHVRTVAQALELPVDWEKDMIYLGGKPGDMTVQQGVTGVDEVSMNLPKTRVRSKAGRYTEIEPYWPAKEEITGTFDDASHIVASAVGGSFGPADGNGGYLSLSITNHSKSDLRLVLRSPRAFSMFQDSIPATIVPAGETVIRTFSEEPYAGYLYPGELQYMVYFNGYAPPEANSKLDVTISTVSFEK